MNKDTKRKVIDQFGKNAQKYVTSETHAKGKDLPIIVEWLNPKKSDVVLDIATGGGHVANVLSPYVKEVYATDLTKNMLANTRNHLSKSCDNISYVIADAESLPFLDNSFDTVTCRIAPHHFPNPEAFIKESARVLKPGGSFLMIDNVSPDEQELAMFMNKMEYLRDPSHHRCLSVNEWRALFSRNNLTEKQSHLRKKIYTFPSWVERTSESDPQTHSVYKHIMNGQKKMQDYFNVTYENNTLKTVSIDEWMTLCRKE